MHVLLSAFGSYGDVLPMVGIGAAMRARGHRVQVIVNPYFEHVIDAAGLEMLPLGQAQEYRELMAHPDLWDARRGLKLVLTRGAAAYMQAAYDQVAANYRPGETVLGAHGLDLASRVFHDKHRAPLATIHFAPFALLSVHATSRYVGMPNLSRWPRWSKRAMFWAADRWMIDPLITPELNRLRGAEGLPPVSRIFSAWNNSPVSVIGMFPEWFGSRQPDWPRQMTLAGFPLWDPPSASAELSREVQDYLDAGEPPIVFAPGSANIQAGDFFRAAMEACQLLGRRGALMTKYPEQLPAELPPHVRRFGFVPFGSFLPRAAALVHHGGIGTCAQGLAAALPQIVMPMAYDQLDNGLRLQRLGVGDVLPPKKFTAPRLAAMLSKLLASDAVRRRAGELAAMCNGQRALAAACDELERLHATRTDRPVKA